MYCDTIRFLLCNFNDEDRAQEAFSHALELSEKQEFAGTKSKHQGFNCFDLLNLAQDFYFKADYATNDIGFMKTCYNCLSGQQGPHNNVTSIKHAFVLSFYFLLRSIRHNDMSIFFEKALKETL